MASIQDPLQKCLLEMHKTRPQFHVVCDFDFTLAAHERWLSAKRGFYNKVKDKCASVWISIMIDKDILIECECCDGDQVAQISFFQFFAAVDLEALWKLIPKPPKFKEDCVWPVFRYLLNNLRPIIVRTVSYQ